MGIMRMTNENLLSPEARHAGGFEKSRGATSAAVRSRSRVADALRMRLPLSAPRRLSDGGMRRGSAGATWPTRSWIRARLPSHFGTREGGVEISTARAAGGNCRNRPRDAIPEAAPAAFTCRLQAGHLNAYDWRTVTGRIEWLSISVAVLFSSTRHTTHIIWTRGNAILPARPDRTAAPSTASRARQYCLELARDTVTCALHVCRGLNRGGVIAFSLLNSSTFC